LQYTDQLSVGGPWTRLANIPARAVGRVEMIRDPNWTTNRFYRVLLPAQ